MKVAIIGTGQQGASIAQALSKSSTYEVSAFDKDETVRTEFSAMTENTPTITVNKSAAEAAEAADIIILATPIDRFAPALQDISNNIKTGAIITDIGSGKVKSIEEIKVNLPKNALYVPAHPIAGKTHSGPASSDAQMYNNETIVIVPQSGQAESQAQITIENMWQTTGGKITYMDAFTHDRLYGTISHFEHVAAFSLVALGENLASDYKKSGNSMLDTTRIAGGVSPEMWIPIFKDNNAAVLASAQGFRTQLDALKAALETDSPAALEELLKPAHEFRKKIEEPRTRESIQGEIHDIANEYKIDVNTADTNDVCTQFNTEANTALVKRTLMPTLIGAAITLNAKDTEENHLTGVKISEVANPSFKDGSAPMLNDPAYLAALLFDNKTELQKQIAVYETEFDTLLEAIRDNDADSIRSYIDRVSNIRNSMPAHRSTEEMREEFIFPVETDTPAAEKA